MAEKIGVSLRTILNWKQKYPEFLRANTAGKEDPNLQIVKSLFQRALGGFTIKETTRDKNGVVIKEVEREVPPDVTAATKWLFNRMPKEWREKTEDLGDQDRDPININLNGEASTKDLDPAQNDNLEISKGTE